MRLLSSLRWSIAVLCAIGVAASLMVFGQGYWAQQRMSQDASKAFVAKDVVADILPPPMYLIEMRLVLSQAVEGTLDAAEARKQVDRLAGEYQARVGHWKQNPPHGLEKSLLGRQHEAGMAFIAAAQSQVIAKLQGGDTEGARQALPAMHQLYLAHRSGVDETVTVASAFAADSIEAVSATQVRSSITALIVAAAATALVVLFSRLVLRSIEAPVERCARMARRFAAGDLAQCEEAETRRDDVIGALQTALCEMQGQLAQIVEAVRRNADGVATASAQIAQGNLDLSSRTEEQASSLQQTAASMEQLTGTVRTSADNARQASQLAQCASAAAVRGGQVVGQVVQTMGEIQSASNRIAEITSVIDGIAFQTNILALNAAVEAARAGEQGRGFAVVASEVRTLAQRSADAARQIKSLIGDSVAKVEAGGALVQDAGSTMNEVVTQAQRVSDLIAEITAASSEQSKGIERVGQAVTQLDQTTQQNAALVEESAAAADSLKTQAERLSEAVAVFKLDRAHA